MRVLWLLAVLGALKVVAAVALFTYVARSWVPLLFLPGFLLIVIIGVAFSRNGRSAKT